MSAVHSKPQPGTSVASVIYRRRILILLCCVLALPIAGPLLKHFVAVNLLMDIVITLILISGVNAVCETPRKRWIGIALAVPMLVSTWIGYFSAARGWLIASNLSGAFFVGYTVIVLLGYIMSRKHVTASVIQGAIVIYFLLGVLWGFLFNLIEMIQPGSINFPAGIEKDSLNYIYFSFVTLTTLGYGDFTPRTPVAGHLAVLEALAGQLYLAVLVARLVGLHISQQTWKDSDDQ